MEEDNVDVGHEVERYKPRPLPGGGVIAPDHTLFSSNALIAISATAF